MSSARVAFAVDQMVIKLGKYLRIVGFDAVWSTSQRTHELILRANREGRVFVTRNTRLDSEYPPALHKLQLTGTDPVAQLHQVLGTLHLLDETRPFSRCIRCNVVLTPIDKPEDIRKLVRPEVFERYLHFYTCPSCGTIFWKGSHVRNTSRKLGIPDSSETISTPAS